MAPHPNSLSSYQTFASQPSNNNAASPGGPLQLQEDQDETTTTITETTPLTTVEPTTKQEGEEDKDAKNSTKPNAKKLFALPPQVNAFAKLLFSHADPVMKLGNERQLEYDDLWELEPTNQTQPAFQEFAHQYAQCNQSMVHTLFWTYGKNFFYCGLGSLFSAACGIFAPVVLHQVIDAFAQPVVDTWNLVVWLSVFFASRIVNAVMASQVTFHMELLAMKMVVSLKSLLFAKAMKRSIQSRGDKTSVDISNLYTSDMDNFLWAAFQLNSLWVLPIQISSVMYLLYVELDLAAFAGLSVIGVSMVITFVLATYEGWAFEGMMEEKDTRMKAIKEVFGAIQIVKFNAWEPKSLEKIMKLRAQEMKFITRFLYLAALSIFVFWSTPLFVSSASFAVYSLWMGKTLTATKVFTSIALFNAIREPLNQLPSVVQQCLQAKVSLDRMSKFLNLSEYDPTAVSKDGRDYPEDVAIQLDNATFGWAEDTAILKDVNMKVKKGDFVVIHGSVGSGKSSLCSAILGEMVKTSGKVFVRGRVAYYSQQPWIQNTSVRDNILFGLPFDQAKYDRVVAACGLLPDFKQFPAGDSTEIGQKGVNLSGGQKARISLARACYVDADILILDSPLAAVDAVVQSEIFNRCLCDLLSKKTVVLVTHSQDIIHSEAGNYKILVTDGVLSGERVDPIQSRQVYSNLPSPKQREYVDAEIEFEEKSHKDNSTLVVEEERSEGRVSKHVFLQYFEAVGGVRVCVWLLAIQTLWQAFQIGSDLWLSHLTGSKDTVVYSRAELKENMQVYALLGCGAALMVLVRSMTISTLGLKASQELFEKMTNSLLHSPLRFFDANPIGRILNRYGDDVSATDFEVPFNFGGFLATSFFTICRLATAVYMVKALGILMLPLVWIYIKLADYSLAPSREVSRLWKVSTSPLLSHVSQCEEGIAVIRAFGDDFVARAMQETFELTDMNNRVWYMETIVSQWFAVRMQLMGCAVVMLVVSALVYLHAYLSPGMVGIAFTYALNVDGGLAQIVRNWSWLEITMVSPERVMEYANLPAEGTEKVLVIEPSHQWPRRGSLTFDKVVFSYKPNAPPVLKGISFAIQDREKIGVVGRTGAGKSSLTMAVFRINELVSGRILIDGVDISTMSLHTLRSRLSIIPQSPVLFKGTLRAYMDPFDEYVDGEIWDAFGKVHLTEMVSELENKLLFELSENGENFSVGERQMLCMARALLRRSRLVIMDEATASIDHATEQKLQEMITRDFTEATVLTIAHRLSTVLDSSRILVLDGGEVVEFDRPQVLLQNTKGAFYRFAKEGGYLEAFEQAAAA